MAALTIKFNYVQDYAVLLREDFIKYVGTILVRKITPKICTAILVLMNGIETIVQMA